MHIYIYIYFVCIFSHVHYAKSTTDNNCVPPLLDNMLHDATCAPIIGASHHFWTHPSKPTDTSDVVKARREIWKQVTQWLDENDDD